MMADSPVGFTITQRQRLRELGASTEYTDERFTDTATREARFKELERALTSAGRQHLAALREQRRTPLLSELTCTLRSTLRNAGLVEVLTPHIISAEALAKMSIPAGDPLAEQIFWLDRSHCLRPMLAPNLYTLLRRLRPHWHRPFAIFEIGTCFRKDTRGSRHLNEFTMLNLVELGTALPERHDRLRRLAHVVLQAAEAPPYEFRVADSGVYGTTIDVAIADLEVCSAAMGPHPLDDAWGITDPWVGLGFGLERLLLAREGCANIERVGRGLSYLDGTHLHL